MEIISRKEAKALGLKMYYTGKACLRGHVAERLVCQKGCLACEKERRDRRDKDAFKKYWKKFTKQNPHYESQRNALYRKKNPESVKAKKRRKYQRDREKVIARTSKNYHKNKDAINFKKREKRALEKLAKRDKQPT